MCYGSKWYSHYSQLFISSQYFNVKKRLKIFLVPQSWSFKKYVLGYV